MAAFVANGNTCTKINKCKQQVVKAFKKQMLEKKKRCKRSNIHQESSTCVEDAAL
jgi:hypothetical protein